MCLTSVYCSKFGRIRATKKRSKDFFLFANNFFLLSAACCLPQRHLCDRIPIYLDEIEAEFQNTLACFSGAKRGSNHQKTEGRKSHVTLPLMGEAFEAL